MNSKKNKNIKMSRDDHKNLKDDLFGVPKFHIDEKPYNYKKKLKKLKGKKTNEK